MVQYNRLNTTDTYIEFLQSINLFNSILHVAYTNRELPKRNCVSYLIITKIIFIIIRPFIREKAVNHLGKCTYMCRY